MILLKDTKQGTSQGEGVVSRSTGTSSELPMKMGSSSAKFNVIVGVIMGIIAFLIFLIIGIKALQKSGDASRTLEFVHVIMRHGERTPVSTYPNDPHINETFYPVGWGQITNAGKQRLYNVGKYLRRRYGPFLGPHYSPDEYFTQSTGVDRTKVSVQMVNAGLWPPQGDQQWGPLDWQPLPVTAERLEDDSLLLVRRPCPQYHIEKDRVMNSPEVQNMMKPYENLFMELTDITGQNVTDFEGVQDIFNTLMAQERYGLSLPEWTKTYYPDRMYYPTIQHFILNAYNDKMNRFIGGVLLKKLIQDWKSKAAGTIEPSARKAILYGGHDATVVNLLRTLKVWDDQFPDYDITVLFELYRDNTSKDYGVKIFLRNSTNALPFKLTIPGCDSLCPLSKLQELTINVIPQNWEEECKTEDDNFIVPRLRGP